MRNHAPGQFHASPNSELSIGNCAEENIESLGRRSLIRHAGTGLSNIALTALLARKGIAADATDRASVHPPAVARRIIFLFMWGGPSQVDTFDPKPMLEDYDGKPAPKLPEITFAAANGRAGNTLWKSPFSFERHGQSGLPVSNLFPHVAKHADDLCVIHSLHGTAPDHGAAVLKMNTGSSNFVRPSFGSWVLHGLGSENENLPGFISICPPAGNGGVRNYGAAFLPARHQGTALGQERSDPADAVFHDLTPGHPIEIQRRQLDLIRRLDGGGELAAANSKLDAHLKSLETAFRMQMSAPDVLDLSVESQQTRRAYGLDDPQTRRFGTQCLMARRLSESGVRFVQLNSGFIWDTHNRHVPRSKKAAKATDQPIAALLQDLKQRGLLDETLVVWGGEFGRTPTRESGDGRDHNPHGYTMWLAGGGVKGGMRFGQTDDFGYYAVQNKVHLHDLHATLLHQLGLNHERLTYRYAGRDFRLTDVHGRVVREIVEG